LKEGKFVNESDLIGWIKSKIAAYKYLRYVEFLAELPMSATGKILKKELRKS
jgi:long-chain acyl-CoA synthetase